MQTRIIERAIEELHAILLLYGMPQSTTDSLDTVKETYWQHPQKRYAKPKLSTARSPGGVPLRSILSPVWRIGLKQDQREPVTVRLQPQQLVKLYQCALFLEINLTDALCEALAHSMRGRFARKTREQYLHDFLDAMDVKCQPVVVIDFESKFVGKGW